MDTRFVIPTDADSDAVAWPGYRPETWRELADGCPIENLGSAWCLYNGIAGLGFLSGSEPPLPAPEPPADGGNP